MGVNGRGKVNIRVVKTTKANMLNRESLQQIIASTQKPFISTPYVSDSTFTKKELKAIREFNEIINQGKKEANVIDLICGLSAISNEINSRGFVSVPSRNNNITNILLKYFISCKLLEGNSKTGDLYGSDRIQATEKWGQMYFIIKDKLFIPFKYDHFYQFAGNQPLFTSDDYDVGGAVCLKNGRNGIIASTQWLNNSNVAKKVKSLDAWMNIDSNSYLFEKIEKTINDFSPKVNFNNTVEAQLEEIFSKSGQAKTIWEPIGFTPSGGVVFSTIMDKRPVFIESHDTKFISYILGDKKELKFISRTPEGTNNQTDLLILDNANRIVGGLASRTVVDGKMSGTAKQWLDLKKRFSLYNQLSI